MKTEKPAKPAQTKLTKVEAPISPLDATLKELNLKLVVCPSKPGLDSLCIDKDDELYLVSDKGVAISIMPIESVGYFSRTMIRDSDCLNLKNTDGYERWLKLVEKSLAQVSAEPSIPVSQIPPSFLGQIESIELHKKHRHRIEVLPELSHLVEQLSAVIDYGGQISSDKEVYGGLVFSIYAELRLLTERLAMEEAWLKKEVA